MPGHIPVIRAATPADAPALADFVEFASEGWPSGLEQDRRSGWGCLGGWARAARRETGSFSYRNALVVEADGGAVAGLIGYPLPDTPSPLHRTCRPFRALAGTREPCRGQLVCERAGRLPRERRKGLGTALLDLACQPSSRGGPASASSFPMPTPAHAGFTSAAAIAKPAGARC